jgi:hypothetical protein
MYYLSKYGLDVKYIKIKCGNLWMSKTAAKFMAVLLPILQAGLLGLQGESNL